MTAVAVQIRRLSLADLAEIEEIEQRAYHTPWSRSMFASELAKGTSICLGAFEGDRLVGYIVNSRCVDAWHVMNVAVDPDERRQGIASALLAALYERVGDRLARYTLEVRRSNQPAIELYERDGFRASGLRRRYYQDNGEDALIMWRTPATLNGGGLDDVPNADPVTPSRQ
jgi:[ribosomal protein S18]-alanine N-acetyltransferase